MHRNRKLADTAVPPDKGARAKRTPVSYDLRTYLGPTVVEVEARSSSALKVMAKPLSSEAKAKIAAFSGMLVCGPRR